MNPGSAIDVKHNLNNHSLLNTHTHRNTVETRIKQIHLGRVKKGFVFFSKLQFKKISKVLAFLLAE